MAFNKKTIEDVDVAGKRVLVRVDFNVPQDETGRITDDRRIRAALPTIQYLMAHQARVVLASHLGRPKGGPEPKYSLQPVAARLSELLGQPVPLAPDSVGDAVKAQVNALGDGDVLLLENVRFYPQEEKNDPAFAAAARRPRRPVRQRRLRHGPPRPRLHRGRRPPPARLRRLPAPEGIGVSRQHGGKSPAPVRRHPRRREGQR